MKTVFIIITSTLLSIYGQSQVANDIIGTWFAEELEESTIKIYENDNGEFYGKIIESKDNEIVEVIVLRGFEFHAKKKIWEGEIYSPKRDMTIDAEITMESNSRLKLEGSVMFLTKTFYWDRV
ncbi:MAG: DUF2147 domain-containing protein [Flavobacteriales bacterium]|nr:DUF2147 domain-containing protein [Flavobacteriales bacterium]